MIEDIIGVHVVPGDLDGHDMLAGRQVERQFIHPVITMRRAGRAVSQETAVHEGAVDRRGRQAQKHGLRGVGNTHRGAEADEIVHDGPTSGRPDGLCGLKADRQCFDTCAAHLGILCCMQSNNGE